MARQRHLKNAPIREAIIGIQVKARAGFDAPSLDSLKEKVEKEYSISSRRIVRETQLAVERGEIKDPHLLATFPDTYMFRSADGLHAFQAGLEGFTFNRLKPYTKWESFCAEGRRLWDLYARTASPEAITRVDLRFINEIDLPEPIGDLSGYVTVQAPIAATISTPIAKFLGRTSLVYEEVGAICVVTVALQPGIGGAAWSFLLDIDVTKPGRMDCDGEEAWNTIEELRTIKNEVFFGTITEKTAKRYD